MCGEASGGCIPTVALVAILFGEGVLSRAVFVCHGSGSGGVLCAFLKAAAVCRLRLCM